MIVTPATPALPTHLQTVDAFEEWERTYPREGSYEFVRGHIIPKSAMKQNEIFITSFLVRQFYQSSLSGQGDDLLPELDSYVDGSRKRIPDLTYVTADQKQGIRRGERISPRFAIEILSDSESYEDVLDKLQDYFDGGVQLVWYTAPKQQKIFVYTSRTIPKPTKGRMLFRLLPLCRIYSLLSQICLRDCRPVVESSRFFQPKSAKLYVRTLIFTGLA